MDLPGRLPKYVACLSLKAGLCHSLLLNDNQRRVLTAWAGMYLNSLKFKNSTVLQTVGANDDRKEEQE